MSTTKKGRGAAAPVINEATQKAFENLGNLVALIADGTARIEALSAELDEDLRNLIDEHREEVTELQASVLEAQRVSEALCKAHRHWFGGKQSLALLHGTAAFRKTTALTVPNEVAAIAIIKEVATQAEQELFVRVREVLDLEALEKLEDKELARFGILRTTTETFKVTARKAELAKAAAAEPRREAA